MVAKKKGGATTNPASVPRARRAPVKKAAESASAVIRTAALDPALLRRVVIESVTPEIDAGQFPIKRTPGEDVRVEADVFADGHDVVVARLLWRARGSSSWSDTAMEPLGNDRWAARFRVED